MKKHRQLVEVTRKIPIPDYIRIERFSRCPELGPKILFFSGGTALTHVSKYLTNFTHNSIHLITPFDSGGSSAELRRVFRMPAIGDVRARIMSLADKSIKGNLEVIELFAFRLPKNVGEEDLKLTLKEMALGKHILVQAIPHPLKKIVCAFLSYFCENMPRDINLQGASIGNLILTSGYLQYHRELDSVIYLFSQLVGAKGIVRPTVDAFAHLCVKLENNTVIIGQNHFSGKEFPHIKSSIEKMWLSHSLENDIPVCVPLQKKTAELIQKADLICYPFGSFFSSLLANFLPNGVGTAIQNTFCPKVFIPSIGEDPELFLIDIYKQTELLLHYLQKENPNILTKEVLNYILLDKALEDKVDHKFFLEKQIQPLFYPLITNDSTSLHCEKKLCEVLLSLC